MSAQAIAARAERDHARDTWRNHQKVCAGCAQAARARRPKLMCGDGRALNQAHADAQAALSREIQADKAPASGQVPLFGPIPGGQDG